MSFTDGKARIATEVDCQACWSGGKPGARFRCYLCGIKFKVGDTWRFVYNAGDGLINILVCSDCDGDDVQQRWQQQCQEAEQRFWWLTDHDTWSEEIARTYHYRNAENYVVKNEGGSGCQATTEDE